MRRTFPLHDLGNEEFENLVASICFRILGTGTIVFATGRDGGRDATFNGTASRFPGVESPLSGKFIIQAKHTSNPVASCSDPEFGRILIGEHAKVAVLIGEDELEHYLVFTNRKKPADDVIAKEHALRALGLETAHILGSEQIRAWLTEHAEIWSNLGFDRFETPFKIQTDDLTTVITAFHSALGDGKIDRPQADGFVFVAKPEKNRINRLSDAYFQEMQRRSLPYFETIADFLKNPRNIALREMYEDTADEIRRKLITALPPFATFDEALTSMFDLVTANNAALRTRRRFAAIFLDYMYNTCDIGQHADPVETS